MSSLLPLSLVTVPLVFTDGGGNQNNLNLSVDLSDAKTASPAAIAARLGLRFSLSTPQVSAIETVIQHVFQRHAVTVMQARGVSLSPLTAPCYELMCSSTAAAAAAAAGRSAGASGPAAAAPRRKGGDALLPATTGEKSLLAKLVKKTGRPPKSAGAAAAASGGAGSSTTSGGSGGLSSSSSKAAGSAASPARQPSAATMSSYAGSGSTAGGAPGSVPLKRKREREGAHRDGAAADADADSDAAASEYNAVGTASQAAESPEARAGHAPGSATNDRRGRKTTSGSATGGDAPSAAAADEPVGMRLSSAGAEGSGPPAKRARAAPRTFADEFAEDLRSRGSGTGSASGSGSGGGKGKQARSSNDEGGGAAKRGRSRARAGDAEEAAADTDSAGGAGLRRRKSKGSKGERRRKGGADADADADADDSDVEQEDESNEDGNVDYCHHCRKAGDLVCCDRCPRSFHPPCMGVAVESLPDGPWLCPLCVEQLGPKREREGRSDGVLCTVYFDGPFTAPRAKFAGDRRREMADITAALLAHEFAPPFASPVPEELRDDGYFDIIRKPMDLGTVASRIESGKYATGDSSGSDSFDAVRCAADLRLVFNNCIVFNKVQSCFWRMAEGLHFALEAALRDRLSLSEEETSRLRRLRDIELKRIPRPEIKGL